MPLFFFGRLMTKNAYRRRMFCFKAMSRRRTRVYLALRTGEWGHIINKDSTQGVEQHTLHNSNIYSSSSQYNFLYKWAMLTFSRQKYGNGTDYPSCMDAYILLRIRGVLFQSTTTVSSFNHAMTCCSCGKGVRCRCNCFWDRGGRFVTRLPRNNNPRNGKHQTSAALYLV